MLLAGRGWRLPRIVTQLVGPGVVWAAFVVTLVLFFTQANGDFTYWTWIKSGSFELTSILLLTAAIGAIYLSRKRIDDL